MRKPASHPSAKPPKPKVRRRPANATYAGSGNRLREIRLSRGWSLEDIAERMKTTAQAVGRWETTGGLTTRRLPAVAAAYGVTPSQAVDMGAPLPDAAPQVSDEEMELVGLYRLASGHARQTIIAMLRGVAVAEHATAEFKAAPTPPAAAKRKS